MAPSTDNWHPSPYDGQDAQTAARTFMRRYHRIKATCVVVALASMFVAAWFLRLTWSFWVIYILILIGMAVVEVILLKRAWTGLMGIHSHDRNPQLFVSVLDQIMPRFARRRKITRMLEIWYGTASFSMGYDDISLAWVERALSRNPDLKDSNWVLAVEQQALCALHRGDFKTVAQYREQLEHLHSAHKSALSPTDRVTRLVMASIDIEMAIRQGDTNTAIEKVGMIEALIVSPLQELSVEFRKGRIADMQGNTEAARQYFSFVAAHGGTTAMRQVSQKWLDEHA